MATATTLKRKGEEPKKAEEEGLDLKHVTRMVNTWLDLASKSRRGLASNLQEFEAAGLESRKERTKEEFQKPPLAVVVSKNKRGMVPVSQAGPGEVTVAAVARGISPHMTVAAIEKAEALGDKIDHANIQTPGQLNFRSWVKGG
jgi:hypothetical protein